MTYEVFHDKSEKLKDKKLGFDAYRHHFYIDFDDGSIINFHVDDPDFYAIHLDSKLCRPVDFILFGTAVLDNKEFIQKIVKLSVEKHSSVEGEKNVE